MTRKLYFFSVISHLVGGCLVGKLKHEFGQPRAQDGGSILSGLGRRLQPQSAFGRNLVEQRLVISLGFGLGDHHVHILVMG